MEVKSWSDYFYKRISSVLTHAWRLNQSPAGGELDDSHATPKSNLNILGYGCDFRLSVPLVNVIRDSHFSQPWA